MKATVNRWGNSLALRIPKGIAESAGLSEGGPVELSVEDGRLIVEAPSRRRWDLDELLKGVTSRNRHEEIPTGKPRGKEVW